MPTPPPGAQISEDGYYWWNENTGDPNEPARWEVVDDSPSPAAAAAGTGATQGAASAAQSSSPAQTSSQDPSQDPSQQQSDAGDVTLEWEYTADDDMGVGLDDLVASGWEPGSEDETA